MSLRELAEAATPGPYSASQIMDDGRWGIVVATTAPGGSPIVVGTNRNLSSENAAFIAACSPERILALLDCIAAADAMRENIGLDPDWARDDYDAKRAAVRL